MVISQMEPTIGEPDKKGENVVTGIVAIEDRKYRVACNCPHSRLKLLLCQYGYRCSVAGEHDIPQ